ncbi:hypothetical protein [Alteriqipengyuania lutimaris]|uniref:Copper resistance protein NlpE n=1 Tax=Alteriqipengyuania lutimaris TaxID=1538146 RepID=A0A395LL62_9SPHN|nr:hypothetical protein [Alteriqipengyuania lutimaris]MBB3033913.1 hypothetical protein [Alteriqipengyuania lutimaris]RDS77127.1 hypothetical protein DL238_05530 [Alteriqipengyuania lutimaris]
MHAIHFLALATTCALAACKPPAADSYEGRVEPPEPATYASEPQPSPDAQNAIWAPSGTPLRLLYGVPGQTPFAAIACEMEQGDEAAEPQLRVTRFARADEGAQALMAIIGNGHRERFPVEAVDNGRAFLWEGTILLASEKLDVLTGLRRSELTIPGAGTLALNASDAPRDLIETCRLAARKQPPDREPSPE